LNFSLFQWLEGTEIKEVSNDNIIHAAEFIALLVELSKYTSYEEFQLASAACFSGQMIEHQIKNRYKKISDLSHLNSDLQGFLENDFINTFDKILLYSKKLWPGKFDAHLSDDYQILSPSDFGFHNTLLTEEGLKFIDLEYFGWDDPVKLTCDFLLHPGMVLTDNQKTLWINRMKSFFSYDNFFHQRLTASYCLYGLCWCLIILNVFIVDSQKKKGITSVKNNDLDQKQTKQLENSKQLLKHLIETHKHGLPYA
jgi:hypothetical protein